MSNPDQFEMSYQYSKLKKKEENDSRIYATPWTGSSKFFFLSVSAFSRLTDNTTIFLPTSVICFVCFFFYSFRYSRRRWRSSFFAKITDFSLLSCRNLCSLFFLLRDICSCLASVALSSRSESSSWWVWLLFPTSNFDVRILYHVERYLNIFFVVLFALPSRIYIE